MSSQQWRLGKLTRGRTDGSAYWSWCIIWNKSDGGRGRVSLGTTDKAAAQTLAREFWSKLTLSSVETVGQVIDAYLATLPDPRAKPDMNTASAIKGSFRKHTSWKAAKPFWGNLTMDQIDEQTSGDYVDWRKRASNTLRNELGLIRTALNWAAKRKLIPSAPRIVLPAMPESTVEHLSKPQFRKFLAGCRAPHVVLFAQLAVLTGGRAKALLELTWDRVDLERGLLTLNPPGRVQKANKTRATVPLNDRAMSLLGEARAGATSDFVIEHNGGPIGDIKKGILAASQRSGVHASPHVFRHSAAVWMAEDRTPMDEIARFLGHTDTRITSRVYAKFSPDYLRRAAKSLDW
jgi:integrase